MVNKLSNTITPINKVETFKANSNIAFEYNSPL